MKRRPTFLITMLAFGFAFFYIPILSMIVYSFNASRLATVWGGFSTKWYVALFSNDKVIEALILSLKIAFVSATIATLLGTMSGIVLARYTKFRGRTLFSDASLQINPGDRIGLIGPNGAGKSTLFSLILKENAMRLLGVTEG